MQSLVLGQPDKEHVMQSNKENKQDECNWMGYGGGSGEAFGGLVEIELGLESSARVHIQKGRSHCRLEH